MDRIGGLALPETSADALADLQSENALLRDAMERMPHGICAFDGNDRLVLANARYREIWSLPETAVQPGTPFAEILRLTPGTETPLSRSQPQPVAGSEGCRRREWQLNDGRIVEVVVSRRADGSCVALHDDVTALREAQTRIAYMARHDLLTGLPNRSVMREELDRNFMRGPHGEDFALLYIDLDRFKPVNDTFGHATGDALLQQVAMRLRNCARENDVVVRLGGDEFAVVQCGALHPSGSTALARRIIESLSSVFDVDGRTIGISASVGIAVAPADGSDPEALLRSADLALYRAKSDGRGTLRYFEAEMDALMQARRGIEADLRQALEKREFWLAYQPQVDRNGRHVCGVEALLRWQHPQRGVVPPLDFIALAEETRLIVPIGRWVLLQACRDARAWASHVRVAVNVSAVQFQNGELLTDVLDALRLSGLPPERLELEITESVMLRDTQQVLATLHALRSRGVCVAMDDFGTGYSSLGYLRSFPFDRIKIDRSFVRDVESNVNTQAIIRAIIDLGRSMGMCTTVEGVETLEQMLAVQRQGDCEMQGFLFSQPRPAEDIDALIRSFSNGRAHSVQANPVHS